MDRIQLIAVTAVVLSVSAGCTKPGRSDDAITNDIKAKLYSDPSTKDANIAVAVKNGAVTLSGDAPNSDVELEAMKVANATPGVSGVSDQIKVNAASATPSQLPDAGSPMQPGQSGPAATAPAPVMPPPAAPAAQSAPMPAAPVQQRVALTVPAGSSVSVQMIDSIDSAKNSEGQTFRASLAKPLMSGGRVVVPAGSDATVLLAGARGAGRIKGNASLEVRLASVQYMGKTYQTDSSAVQETGKGGRGKSTAIRTGIGAAAGAVIGALAGGGKGAAIGSAAGGGAGFGVNALTHGSQVKIAPETVLIFTLQSPITITKEPR